MVTNTHRRNFIVGAGAAAASTALLAGTEGPSQRLPGVREGRQVVASIKGPPLPETIVQPMVRGNA
jgi:hypothetical protein